jgi:prepilin-type processing-associated H-X9-DG protein
MTDYAREHNGQLPPAYIADENGVPMHSWRVLILPYLDHRDLYKQYKFDEPWNGPNNRKLASAMPEIYRCPTLTYGSRQSRNVPNEIDQYRTNYLAVVGPDTAVQGTRSQNLDVISIEDGMAQTLIACEVAGLSVPWMQPQDAPAALIHAELQNSDKDGALNHTGGLNVVYADGRGTFLKNTISSEDFEALTTVSGGETTNAHNY